MQTNPFKSTIRAHLYVWDEPLNYIDVYSRIQIENLIRQFRPTMVLVEHDAAFRQAVSTDVIPISNRQEGCPSCHPKPRLPLYIRKNTRDENLGCFGRD